MLPRAEGGEGTRNKIRLHPFHLLLYFQILKMGENAIVEVAAAWGGMNSLIELEAQVSRQLSCCHQRARSVQCSAQVIFTSNIPHASGIRRKKART